jgi:anaerobic magnesium-protoporphyrin IX monomethyl ester cyclase
MKYLHVCPPWYVFYGNNLRQPSTPLGAAYCAGAAIRAGWSAVIWNGDLLPVGGDIRYSEEMTGHHDYLVNQSNPDNPVWRELRQVLQQVRPDVVGVTALSPAYPSALRVCQIVKDELGEHVHTVIGGPHANALPRQVAAAEHVDAVVFGEGEGPLTALLDAWRVGNDHVGLAGVVARNKAGEVVVGPDGGSIKNLDDLGWPAKGNVFDQHGLLKRDNHGLVMFSRGCPYKCEFCASPSLWTHKVRFRTPADMADEMLAIHKMFDTRYFSFEDDTFTLNRRRIMELMDEIIARGLPQVPGFRWTANTRPDCVDEELLTKMKAAGCAAVAVGVEFGSPRMLQKMRKDFTADDARRAVKLIKQVGLISSGQFLVGLPTESPEEMWQTVALADELELDSVMLSVATPLPATPLHEEAVALGLIPREGLDWATITTKNDGILMTQWVDGRHVAMDREERVRLVADLQAAMNDIQASTLARRSASRSWYEAQYLPEDEVTPVYGIAR